MVYFIRIAPFPEELREALRAALRGEPATWPSALGRHEIDALEEHGFLPLVYAHSHMPALRDQAIRAASTEAIRHEELRRVIAGLGIFALIVKGSALAYQVYPAPELRPRSDTDLLIDLADLDTARASFRALGYHEAATSGDDLAFAQRTNTRLDDLGCAHVFDVHWEIANPPLFAGALRFAELKPRAVGIDAPGPRAYALPPVEAPPRSCGAGANHSSASATPRSQISTTSRSAASSQNRRCSAAVKRSRSRWMSYNQMSRSLSW